MNRFRKPTKVMRRLPGEYVRGVWRPYDEPDKPEVIMLGIQPATAGDYERLQANQEGRRIAALARVYGPSDNLLTCAGDVSHAPGDLVDHEGGWWLVIGRHLRPILGRPVSHARYLIAREIEAGDGEVPS